MNTLPVVLDTGAALPTRAHPEDAGLDLRTKTTEEFRRIYPGCREFFDTGVHVAIPKSCVGLVCDRSGLAKNRGLTVLGGVIDPEYTGSIGVTLFNSDPTDGYKVEPGEKIAQLLVIPILLLTPQLVESLEYGQRGSAGFGSTGRGICTECGFDLATPSGIAPFVYGPCSKCGRHGPP